MTNQEIDKIIDDVMELFPHSVPKHILDEIKKIPFLGKPLADLLDNLQDPLSREAAQDIKDIAHWLNDRKNGLEDFMDEWMKKAADLIHDAITPDPTTPQPDPNNPIPDQDKDGIPDSIDPDRDGDGIPNDQDPTPDGVPPEPKNGHSHPYNPETPQPHDPLVLDLNRNGIASINQTQSASKYMRLAA